MTIDKDSLLTYLEKRRLPMAQLDGAVQLHSTLCAATPGFYLHLLADRTTEISHKREILWNWLSHPATRELERKQILDVLTALPVEQSLQVIELVSDLRLNGHRAHALVLSFLIGHPQFAQLAATRKRRLVRLLKHALGEATWSSVKRVLAESSEEGEKLLTREIWRYVPDGHAAAREALLFLADLPLPEQIQEPLLRKSEAARHNLELGADLPLQTLLGLRGVYHKDAPKEKVRRLSAPTQRSLHIAGVLTSAYKELLATRQQELNGRTESFMQELRQATRGLPLIEGRLAIVLDLSASMTSSGERLYHPAALALVAVRQLRELVRELIVVQVGGADALLQHVAPAPQGASDLASGLLQALREQPDIVMIVSDGYENVRQGDVARVVAGARQLGLTLPIYQVTPLFTAAENLEQRRLDETLPVLQLAHESDIRELLAYTLLAGAGETLTSQEWMGQSVRQENEIVYLSVFRDLKD